MSEGKFSSILSIENFFKHFSNFIILICVNIIYIYILKLSFIINFYSYTNSTDKPR